MILNELVIYQQAIYFYGNAFLLTWTKHWNSVLYSDGRRFPCRAFDPGRVLQCYSAAAALQQNLSFTRKTKLLLPAILCGTWCDIFIFKRMTIKPLQYFRSHPASYWSQVCSECLQTPEVQHAAKWWNCSNSGSQSEVRLVSVSWPLIGPLLTYWPLIGRHWHDRPLVATSTAPQPGPGLTDQPSIRNLKLTSLRPQVPSQVSRVRDWKMYDAVLMMNRQQEMLWDTRRLLPP